MSKNIPDSCWNNDPTAPWNDITISFEYQLSVNLGGFVFTTELLKDEATFSNCQIKTEEDWQDIEYDLYMIIEDNLDPEIKELDYHINLINYTH